MTLQTREVPGKLLALNPDGILEMLVLMSENQQQSYNLVARGKDRSANVGWVIFLML